MPEAVIFRALPRTIMAGMPEPAADKLPEQVLT